MDEDADIDDRVTTDDSTSSFTGVEVPLADHLAGVADVASGFAARLGVPGDLVADLRLAGEWHDAGKADPRFQRWLHGGSEFKALVQPAPLAKGTARLASRSAMRQARERAGYPAGGRHELMSLVLMESADGVLTARAGDWTLVQHVVASHHGHCRPLAPWVPDPHPVDVSFSRDGIRCGGSSAHDLARLDSGVADRFWQVVRRYGWWGSAWLETLLRLADHRQSESEQITAARHNA
jgi:CRISPR-associated endonuclease/helicase Cas3